ncbi:MAG: phytanoyl-CoA dioxygenase family protein [Spirochaetaceae bacterium]|nr:phytanoyl-CoA dioxygenase family protein [Myxococcales bacterium]MCB9724599.1 phytanoyl-CoA dioxygenase family protein [Spirochaetaceae bacterium]
MEGRIGRVDWRLLDEERRAWEQDGFFAREAVFAADELEILRAAAERVVAAATRATLEVVADPATALDPSLDYEIDGNRYVEAARSTVQFEHERGSSTIRVIEPFHHLDPVLDGLLGDARIVAPLCGVLGADRIALWTDKMNLKRPREGSGFRWHQDSPYWSHVCGHCDQLPNVMITLDDADRDNGCFRVIRGSHARGFLPGLDDGTRLGPLFTRADQFDPADEWLAEVPAGSLVFFSAHTVHGSEPNRSGRARRALVVTYQPADQPMFKARGTRNFSLEAACDRVA